jgi:superfamily II DNA or RNA helicase
MARRILQATVGGLLSIPRDEVPKELRDALYSHLTWKNPAYRDRVFRQQPTRYYDRARKVWIEIPEHIYGIELDEKRNRYLIAREFTQDFENLCDEHKIEIDWHDRRVLFDPSPLVHDIKLWKPQQPAVRDMLSNEYGHQGVLEAPCGSGKTVMLLYVAAELGQPTLILAHTDDLLQQWKSYCTHLLGYEPGIIQGDKFELKQITLASVMTLARRDLDAKFLKRWGCVILDEAHHCPAACFQEVMTRFPAYYRFGATATPEREDNLQGLLYAICGPVIAKVERRALKKAGLIVDPVIKLHETGFDFPYGNMRQWQPMIRALTHNQQRNNQIVENISSEDRDGKHVQLVLSQQIDHLVLLSKLLAKRRPDLSQELLISGGTKRDRKGNIIRDVARTKEERKKAITRARKGRVRVLFGTRLADEGLDIPRLDRLHLVFPTRAKGKVAQQVGRIQRVHPGKTDVVVHDYLDNPKPLKSQWYERRKVYTQMELEIVREDSRPNRAATLAQTANRIRRAAQRSRAKNSQNN